MAGIINKSALREAIEEESIRTQLAGDVIPHFEESLERLIAGIVEADNECVGPNSKATLTKKALKDAILHLDEKHGIRSVLELEVEPREKSIKLEKRGKHIDLNIHLDIDTEDK